MEQAASLWIFLACAGALLVLGAALRRVAARRTAATARFLATLAWIALATGFAGIAALALLHLTGRLGPAQLWFRAPTFYAAAAVLVAGAAWWLARPARPALRFGLPAAALAFVVAGIGLLRAHGASAPLTMLVPTLAQPAPDLTYFDASGNQRRLSELRGHVVLLNFWATWCVPCRREMPLLSKLQRDYGDRGLVVLYLSLEDQAVIDEFLRAQRLDGVQGRLDAAPGFYGAGKFYPLSYLIDREGRVEKRWSGRPAEPWLTQAVLAEL